MSTCFGIRELRQQCGITQAQLAAGLNLKSSSTVTMWEKGDRNPPSSALPQLAEMLGCSIDELYGRSQPTLAARDSAQEIRPGLAGAGEEARIRTNQQTHLPDGSADRHRGGI